MTPIAKPDPPLDLELEVVAEVAPTAGLALADLRALVQWTLCREGATGRWEVSVVLTGDAELRELHRRFMGLDSATDVMTFPLDDAGGSPRGGDVVVSVERAAEQAPEFGFSTAREVRFLALHGLLHLLGWDDATEADRAAMLERQTALLTAFDEGATAAL